MTLVPASRPGMVGRIGCALRTYEQVVAICVSTVLIMAGQGVVAPVLSLYAKTFGVGIGSAGLVLTAFALARLIFNVPFGMLADRHGRRLLLVGGPVLGGIGMLGSAYADSFPVLLAFRFVAGMGSAMYMTGAQIYLLDISTPETRPKYVGMNQAALLAGVAIGPVVGGILSDGIGLRAPFVAVGLCGLVTAAYGFVRLPETLGNERPERGTVTTVDDQRVSPMRFVLSRDFLVLAGVSFAIFATRSGAQQTIMPIYGGDELGLSASMIGLIFTLMALITVIGIVPSTLVVDRCGRKWAICPSGFVTAASLVLLFFARSVQSFTLAALVFAMAGAVLGPAPAVYAGDIAPAGMRGLAMALHRTAGDLGLVLSPPILGLVADHFSLSAAFLANAALVALTASLFAMFARETRVSLAPVTVLSEVR